MADARSIEIETRVAKVTQSKNYRCTRMSYKEKPQVHYSYPAAAGATTACLLQQGLRLHAEL